MNDRKKELNKKYYKENKEKIKERRKRYYEENKEKILEEKKRYGKENKEKIKEQKKIYRKENKQKIKEQKKIYYEENKEKIKKYLEENKEQIKERSKEYYKKNKEKILKRVTQQAKIRYQEDINYRIKEILRKRLLGAIKGRNKSASTMKLLGCTIEELRTHLEAQFAEGMTWDNYGYYGWHIDHIRPCASFDLTDPQQQLECFHYSNLQPLWAEDNIKKSDK